MLPNRSPFRAVAAVLVAALLVLSLSPTAGAVASVVGDDDRSYCERMGHTMPPETPDDEGPGEAPSDGATCCVSAPEAPRDAVVPAPSPLPEGAVAAALATLAPPPTVPASAPAPRDTGPPPGPRLHLAFSVFLV